MRILRAPVAACMVLAASLAGCSAESPVAPIAAPGELRPTGVGFGSGNRASVRLIGGTAVDSIQASATLRVGVGFGSGN